MFSCSQQQQFNPFFQQENSTLFERKVDLKPVGNAIFKLDKKTRFITNSISATYKTEEEIVSFLNSDNQTIEIFNYKSGEKISEIKLDQEGPNGVGNIGYSSAHYFHNEDSIFVYNRQTSPIFLLDRNGKVLNKFKITDYSDPSNIPVPNSMTLSPIHFLEGQLFLTCALKNYEEDFSGYPSLLSLNIKDGKVKYLATLPSIYSAAFWGAYFKYDPSMTIDHINHQLVLSYPVDHFIYTKNLKSGVEDKHFIGSEFIAEILPYESDPAFFLSRNPKERDEKENIHSFSTSEYRGIIFDKNRNVYYRLALIRPSKEKVLQGDKEFSFSIIIMDENFKKIGENLFSTKIYDPSTIFLTSEGLNFFRKDIYEQDEDIIQFEIFAPLSR